MDEFLGIQYESAEFFDDFDGTIEEFNEDMTRSLTTDNPTSWRELSKRPKLIALNVLHTLPPALIIVGITLFVGFKKLPEVSVTVSAIVFIFAMFLSLQATIDQGWEETENFQQLREAAENFGQRYPQLEALRAQYEQSNSEDEKRATSNNFQEALEELSEAERTASESA